MAETKQRESLVCTKKRPFIKGSPGFWEHPDAVIIDEDYGKGGGVADGDYIQYQCPICGHTWWEELPN